MVKKATDRKRLAKYFYERVLGSIDKITNFTQFRINT
jgi:hypothetical protein